MTHNAMYEITLEDMQDYANNKTPLRCPALEKLEQKEVEMPTTYRYQEDFDRSNCFTSWVEEVKKKVKEEERILSIKVNLYAVAVGLVAGLTIVSVVL